MTNKERKFETHIIKRDVDLSHIWLEIANRIRRGEDHEKRCK